MKITFTQDKNPQLIIPEAIYNKMLANVRSTSLEITFILEIQRDKQNKSKFITKGFHLPPQWNEPAESKTLDSQYPKWCVELVKKGIKLNGQGHTHPSMSVNPSGYDVNFFNELVKETNTFQFRLILNQKGLLQCDLIDKEEMYIAEQMDVIIPCEGFNLIVNNTHHKIEITDIKQLAIISLNNDLKATVASQLLAVSATEIKNTPLEKEELLTTQRRFQTDEALTSKVYTSPNHSPHSKKNNNKAIGPSEDEEEYMNYYCIERGFYDGY